VTECHRESYIIHLQSDRMPQRIIHHPSSEWQNAIENHTPSISRVTERHKASYLLHLQVDRRSRLIVPPPSSGWRNITEKETSYSIHDTIKRTLDKHKYSYVSLLRVSQSFTPSSGFSMPRLQCTEI